MKKWLGVIAGLCLLSVCEDNDRILLPWCGGPGQDMAAFVDPFRGRPW